MNSLRRDHLFPCSSLALVLVLAFAGPAWAQQVPDGRLTTLQSAHFSVRFDPERDWILAEPALEALEAGYAAVGDWLGERPASRIQAEILPAAEDVERVTGATRGQIESAGDVGVATGGTIVILSPRLLLRGYPWRDALNHEYVRLLAASLSGNRAPVWLREGLARLGATRWRSPETTFPDAVERSLLARALREDRVIPLTAIEGSLLQGSSPAAARLAIAECADAVDFLIRSRGLEGLRRLLAELARPGASAGLDPAQQAALGEPLAQFEDAWRRALRDRAYEEVPGIALPPRRLAGEGASDDWDLTDWQPLAAQNHLRLGDLLRARGNGRAALIEYEKARSAAPASPYAQLKVAGALLALGKPEQAVAAARVAQRLGSGYPAASTALAAVLQAVGDREGAAAALREALEINPFDPFAWRDLGRVLRQLGRAQEAQRASVNALRLRPGDEAFMRSVMENE